MRCLSTFLWGAFAEDIIARRAEPPPPTSPQSAEEGGSEMTTTLSIIGGLIGAILATAIVGNILKARKEAHALKTTTTTADELKGKEGAAA